MSTKVNIELRYNGAASLDHVLGTIEKAASDLERRSGIARSDMVIEFKVDLVTLAGPQLVAPRG
jgi:hypothetical protein